MGPFPCVVRLHGGLARLPVPTLRAHGFLFTAGIGPEFEVDGIEDACEAGFGEMEAFFRQLGG